MEAEYKHTQFGALTIILFICAGIIVALIVRPLLADEQLLFALVVLVLYLAMVALFFALTVEISDSKIKLYFGIGAVRRSMPINEIQSAEEVKSPWYYFWGVKSIPGGWLYAIAPGPAVELTLKDGKVVRLGTNQPESLKMAVDQAIRSA